MYRSIHSLSARLLLGAFLALGGIATPALAQIDLQGYIGGGLAFGKYNATACSYTKVAEAGEDRDRSVECDWQLGFQFVGGIQVIEHLAFEAGYLTVDESFTSTGSTGGQIRVIDIMTPGQRNIGNGNANFDITGKTNILYAAAVGRWPIGDRFALTGRLGLNNWDEDGELCVENGGCVTISTDGIDPLYGIGAEYDLTDNLRAQFNITRHVMGSDNYDALSTNLVFMF